MQWCHLELGGDKVDIGTLSNENLGALNALLLVVKITLKRVCA